MKNKKNFEWGWFSSLFMAALVLYPICSFSDEYSGPQLNYTQSDFGGVGLLQMPSARMMPDGELSLNVTNNKTYINYALSLQLFPWLESTIRYTQVHDMLYSNYESFSGDNDYTDKSIDAKINVLRESYYLPAVSIGIRDLGGTGLFDSEYIVANKRFGNLDFTLGLGWGYIGNRGNFMSAKSGSSDCGRNTGYQATGGTVELGRMFTGCKSIYGGVEYQTPYDPLILKLEYDGNDYKSDFSVTKGNKTIPVSTPWNIGAVYKLNNYANLRLSYERGNTVTAGLSLSTNVARLHTSWLDNDIPEYSPKPLSQDLSSEEWAKLAKEIHRVAGFNDPQIYKNDATQSIAVLGKPEKYRDRAQSNQRIAMLLANSGVVAREYKIVETSQHIPMSESVIDVNGFRRVADNGYPDASFQDVESRQDVSKNSYYGDLKSSQQTDWSFGLSPSLKQSFGSSENFYLYAIGVNASGSYRFADDFVFSGNLYGRITDNYDQFKYTVPPDGTQLKRVRTLARKYFQDTVRITNLQLTYFDQLSNNLYMQMYGGYLESMFAGVGSEFLYRPFDSNWAFGINANYVKQRDPASSLGLYKQERHYDTDTSRYYYVQTGTPTGHATLYWQPKFWDEFDNTLVKISAGQYLTEDKGVTVDLSKQFDSGVIVGVYATKTNLSAAEYGEGSFTKGFYVSIPLDVMTVKPSTSRINLGWTPLTRDGGQMLNRKYSLYDMTDGRSPWFTRKRME